MGTSAEEVGAWTVVATAVGGVGLGIAKLVARWWRNFWARFALNSDVDALAGRIDSVDKTSSAGVDALRREVQERIGRHESLVDAALTAVKSETRTIRTEMARKDDVEHVREQVDRLVDHLLVNKH